MTHLEEIRRRATAPRCVICDSYDPDPCRVEHETVLPRVSGCSPDIAALLDLIERLAPAWEFPPRNCPHCGTEITDHRGRLSFPHKPDCPWLEVRG